MRGRVGVASPDVRRIIARASHRAGGNGSCLLWHAEAHAVRLHSKLHEVPMTEHDKHDDETRRDRKDGHDMNRDPISDAPGAHPVGTGLGAAGGAATGAAIGTAVGGPIGLAVGGVAGAIAGGLAGKGVAEAVNPTAEDAYWRDNYSSRPYVSDGQSYDEHQPAYRYGWESRSQNAGKKWDEVESDLSRGWDKARGHSSMAWDDAKMAAHDAWDHIDDDKDRMSNDRDRMSDDGALGEQRRMRPSDR